MFKLIGLTVSPWTQRAQWALDVCGIAYSYSEYLPGLGTPLLRLRMRKWSGAVQVPVLLANGEVLAGAGSIARFAAQRASGAPLGDFAAAERWEALGDAAACEGRIRAVRRTLANPAALDEAQEGKVPAPLRPVFRWLPRGVFSGLDKKYGPLAQEGAMRHALMQARTQLAKSGGRALLGQFSYADIALASCMEMVLPLASRAPATVEAWTWPELVAEFGDLLAWRQTLLEQSWPRFMRGRDKRLTAGRPHGQGSEAA